MRALIPTILATVQILSIGSAWGQCKVIHTSGTQTVYGSDVTVTSEGAVDVNTAFCSHTSPYIVGYSYGTNLSGNGGYTFSFDPPVNGLTINFSGATHTAADIENVLLFVNGAHYAIPEVGIQEPCDYYAVLTPEGDLTGCTGCPVSGWDSTYVPGPITTFTVRDSVLTGEPNGTIFSLFLCSGMVGIDELIATGNLLPYPDPANDRLHVDANGAKRTTMTLLDMSGRVVNLSDMSFGESATLRTADFPRGPYILIVDRDATRAAYRVALE